MLIHLTKSSTLGRVNEVVDVLPHKANEYIKAKLASKYEPRVEMKVVTPETKNTTSPKKRSKKVHEQQLHD